jgi:hypothetical protein
MAAVECVNAECASISRRSSSVSHSCAYDVTGWSLFSAESADIGINETNVNLEAIQTY